MRMRHAAVVAGMAFFLASAEAQASIVTYNFAFSSELGYIGLKDTGSFSGKIGVESGNVVEISGSGPLIGDILQLIPAGTFGGNDNLFLSNEPYISSNGISFETSLLGPTNFYLRGSTNTGYQWTLQGYTSAAAGTLTVSSVPLPASAPMFGTALLGLAGLGYAAKRKKAAAAA